jgi:hypothetical protein
LLTRATFDDLAQPAVLRPTFTDDGLGGRALTGAAVWKAPAQGHFELGEGTVEFRLRLDRPPAQIPNWTLFRIRPPGPPADTFANGFTVIHGWGNGLFLLVGDTESRQQPLRYPGTRDWQPGEWHHCAFTWRVGAPGHSSLALYIDESLVERREGLTLRFDRAAWQAAAAGTNQLTILAGAVWGQPVPGAIDDLRIYNHARRYQVNP